MSIHPHIQTPELSGLWSAQNALNISLQDVIFPQLRDDLIDKAVSRGNHDLAAQLKTLPNIAYNSIGEVFAGLEGLRMLEHCSGYPGIDPDAPIKAAQKRSFNAINMALAPMQASFLMLQIWTHMGFSILESSFPKSHRTRH